MSIDLEIKNYRCFTDRHPLRLSIEPGMTAFVGPNNVGKSALLRFFYEFRPLFRQLTAPENPFRFLLGNGLPCMGNDALPNRDEMLSLQNDRPMEITLRHPLAYQVQPTTGHGKGIGHIVPSRVAFIIERGVGTGSINGIAHVGEDFKQVVRYETRGQPARWMGPPGSFEPLVPTLGSLRDMCYIGPFRGAFAAGHSNPHFDVKIGSGFVELWEEASTQSPRWRMDACNRVCDDIKNIFGFPSFVAVKRRGEQRLLVTIGHRQYDLQDLGAGVAEFLIVLACAAIARPSYILVDEPEAHLHPGMQLRFLSAIASYAREGVLFATHSYGLARAAADRIYSVSAIGDEGSVVQPVEMTPNLIEFMGEMNYSAQHQIGFDAILLVEGVTELRTVGQFLRHCGLDHRVMPLHLGGAALINEHSAYELDEMKRLCPRMFVLVDSERDGPGADLPMAREKFKGLCEGAEMTFHALDRRAIENYLTDAAIKRRFGDKYRALGPHERLQDVNPAWAKRDNWLIAREMTRADIEGTDLDAFFKGIEAELGAARSSAGGSSSSSE